MCVSTGRDAHRGPAYLQDEDLIDSGMSFRKGAIFEPVSKLILHALIYAKRTRIFEAKAMLLADRPPWQLRRRLSEGS